MKEWQEDRWQERWKRCSHQSDRLLRFLSEEYDKIKPRKEDEKEILSKAKLALKVWRDKTRKNER